MQGFIRRFLAASVIATAGLGSAHAYSSLVVFGDSLADTGNVVPLSIAVSGQAFPAFPGAVGRFSNGPVWVEHLATGLGLPLGGASSNLYLSPITNTVVPIGMPGGGNFSFGGARAGMDGVAGPNTGLFGQLTAWNGSTFAGSLERAADPDALYVLMIGANDLRDIRSNGSLSAAQRDVAAQQAAQGVIYAMNLLAEAGANHFMISTVPDLGKTPEAQFLNLSTPGLAAASTAVTLSFNQALTTQAQGLDQIYQNVYGRDLDIRTLDFYGLYESVVQDALFNGGGVYGITNVMAPCLATGPFSGLYFAPDSGFASNCNVAAFSDPLHPSAKAHALLGAMAVQVATVPEPETYAMLLVGLVLVGRLAQRARRAR